MIYGDSGADLGPSRKNSNGACASSLDLSLLHFQVTTSRYKFALTRTGGGGLLFRMLCSSGAYGLFHLPGRASRTINDQNATFITQHSTTLLAPYCTGYYWMPSICSVSASCSCSSCIQVQ